MRTRRVLLVLGLAMAALLGVWAWQALTRELDRRKLVGHRAAFYHLSFELVTYARTHGRFPDSLRDVTDAEHLQHYGIDISRLDYLAAGRRYDPAKSEEIIVRQRDVTDFGSCGIGRYEADHQFPRFRRMGEAGLSKARAPSASRPSQK